MKPKGLGGFMNTAILIFLILNFLVLGFFVSGIIYIARCEDGKAARENVRLENERDEYKKRLEDYKEKQPLKARFKLDEEVLAIVNDRVCKGKIVAITCLKDEKVNYRIVCANKSVIDIGEKDVFATTALQR